MREIIISLYKPHRGQKPIHRSKARFRVVTCGRRFGKTYLGCNEIIDFASKHPRTLSVWVAPTYRQTKIAYRLIKQALSPLNPHTSDSELRIELPNDAVMMFASSDNYDALRGNGIHFLVCDEFATIAEKAWTEVLRPCLSDTNGKALLLGTPKGRNLFYRLFMRGLDPDYPEWECFKAPTSANPYIAPAEVEAAKKELPEDTYQQEYEAEFLEDGAGVFRRIDDCVYGSLNPNYTRARYNPHQYILGWDPAKYNDYSVLTLLDANTMRVEAWERFNTIDYTKQIEQVVSMAERFNAYVMMDSTGIGDALLDHLKPKWEQSEGYLLTNASKKILIEKLQLAFQDRAIHIPDEPILLNELRQFEYHLTPSRNIVYEAPEGMHDDAVISLALAWYAAQQNSIEDNTDLRDILTSWGY